MMTAAEKVLQLGRINQRKFKENCPVIGLDLLTWRVIDLDTDKKISFFRPTFALFDVDLPDFELGVDGYNTGNRWFFPRMTPILPSKLMDCYDDVFEEMKKLAERSNQSIKLVAKLKGCFPDVVKEEIEKAKKVFEHVYILVEIITWKPNQEAVLPKDPLVLGLRGDRLYVLKQFDLTSNEAHAAQES